MPTSLSELVDAAAPGGLRQPDQQSCGAACLVVARMLLDPEFAEFVRTGVHPHSGWREESSMSGRFSARVVEMHRHLVGPRAASGRLQVPWLRAVGTPPWATASQLSWTAARLRLPTRYLFYPAWWRLDHVFDRIQRATEGSRPVALYVGNRRLPRHVVLITGATTSALSCYEPARGVERKVTREQFVKRRLDLAGWDRPWFMVIPTGRRAAG